MHRNSRQSQREIRIGSGYKHEQGRTRYDNRSARQRGALQDTWEKRNGNEERIKSGTQPGKQNPVHRQVFCFLRFRYILLRWKRKHCFRQRPQAVGKNVPLHPIKTQRKQPLMKKMLLLAASAGLFSFAAGAQPIKKVLSYAKSVNDTRLLVLKSDNTLWWSANNKPWNTVDKKGLPATDILDLEVYQKSGFMSLETRLVCLLADNGIWWYADGKSWEKIETKGLPQGKKITDITVYMKNQGVGESMRLIALLDDNSLWWFAPNKDWEKVTSEVAAK